MWARRSLAICALAAVGGLLSGCPSPVSGNAERRAILAEARQLIARYPPGDTATHRAVPADELPSAIARLAPESVFVRPWGVDITMKPYFDGGWGYYIPREGEHPPMPGDCLRELAPGLFWHGPC